MRVLNTKRSRCLLWGMPFTMFSCWPLISIFFVILFFFLGSFLPLTSQFSSLKFTNGSLLMRCHINHTAMDLPGVFFFGYLSIFFPLLLSDFWCLRLPCAAASIFLPLWVKSNYFVGCLFTRTSCWYCFILHVFGWWNKKQSFCMTFLLRG